MMVAQEAKLGDKCDITVHLVGSSLPKYKITNQVKKGANFELGIGVHPLDTMHVLDVMVEILVTKSRT